MDRTRPPAVAAELLALLVLLPLAGAVAVSAGLAGGQSGYAWWWQAGRGWQALARTMQLAAPAALLAAALGWVLAAAARRWSRRWAAAAVVLACLPMLFPGSALATAWIVAAGPGRRLGGLLAKAGFDLFGTPPAAVLLALQYLGIAAAAHLWLKPAGRAAAVGGLLVLLLAMNDRIVPERLLVATHATEIRIQYSARLDAASAAALAVPVAGLSIAVGAAALLIARGGWRGWGQAPRDRPPATGRWLRVVGAVLSIPILLAVLVAPIIVLASSTGSFSAVADAVAAGRGELRRTLTCVAVAAAVCVGVATLLAWHWARCRQAGRFTAVPLVLLNLTVPASLLGIGAMALTRHWPLRPLRGTSWPLIFAYVARFLPVATLALYAAWRNRPAAEAPGAGRGRKAGRGLRPGRAALLAAALLCAVLMTGEMDMSALLNPPAPATLGARLSRLIHQAPDSAVCALTCGMLALVAPFIVLLLAAASVARRRRRSGRKTHSPTAAPRAGRSLR